MESAKPDTVEKKIIWINVVIGAFLMVATLPGRTQGLGLITEPLLADLGISHLSYASVNLWATLLGAAACLPVGWLIDRVGLRPVTLFLLVTLAFCTWRMSALGSGVVMLFIWVFLTRALGQSGLSVASITTVGKAAGRNNGLAMGVFSLLLSVLFAVAFILVGGVVSDSGWRPAWSGIALVIAVLVLPLTFFFLREPLRRDASKSQPGGEGNGLPLVAAMRTPLFWICGGGVALFGFAASGLGLFNEAVLAEIGFDHATYHRFLAVSTIFALAGQMLCGWLSLRRSMTSLLAFALLLYAIAFALLPHARGPALLWTIAVIIGVSAGFITVLFFAIWGHAYGRRELGRIQGVAQALTVFASALGPLAFATMQSRTGSYAAILYAVAVASIVFAIGALALRKDVFTLAEDPTKT